MITFGEIHYDFPAAGYLIFFSVLLFFLFWKLHRYRRDLLANFFNNDSLSILLVNRDEGNFWGKTIGICLIWILAAIALMQPKGGVRYPEDTLNKSSNKSFQQNSSRDATLRRKAHEVVLLIDASASMNVPDVRNGQTRFDFAKEIADQIGSRLTGETVSLYVFTSELMQTVPPTLDYLFTRLMIRNLQINEGDTEGTDFYHALQGIKERYLNTPSSVSKSLVILSDGGDTAMESLEGSERKMRMESITGLLDKAKEDGMQTFTVGIGSLKGGNIPDVFDRGIPVRAVLEEGLMQELAQKGMGKYYFADRYAAPDLAKDIVKEMALKSSTFIDEKIKEPAGQNENEKNLVYDLYYQFPLGLAILILGFVLFTPDTVRLKKWVGLSALLFSFSLGAETPDETLKKAAVFFEAGDFNSALETYDGLLKGELNSWQKAVTMYNQATAFMAAGKPERALEIFRMIKIEPSFSPALESRLKKNQAIALIRRIGLQAPLLDTSAAFLQAAANWKNVLNQLNEASQAYCRLKNAQGQKVCQIPIELVRMKKFADFRLAQILENDESFRIKNMTAAEFLLFAQWSVDILKREIDFLLNAQTSPTLKTKYEDLFIKNADTWMPLWLPIVKKEQQQNPKAKETLLLGIALKYYRYVIRFLEKGNLSQALEGIKEIQPILMELKGILWKNEGLRLVLRDLYETYQDTLDYFNIQENDLTTLEDFHRQLDQVSLETSIKTKLDAAKKLLLKGISSYRQNNNEETRLYIEAAAQEIKRLLKEEAAVSNHTPKDILENALDEQMHALLISGLAASLKDKDPGIEPILRNAQTIALQVAASFLKASFVSQKEKFNAALTPGEKDNRCQSSPWDLVIPLYEKGIKTALRADQELEKYRLPQAQIMQSETVKAWNQAIDELKNPKEASKCKGSFQSRSNSSSSSTSSQSSSAVDMENVIQLIEQMDNEDKLPKKPSQPPIKVERPW